MCVCACVCVRVCVCNVGHVNYIDKRDVFTIYMLSNHRDVHFKCLTKKILIGNYTSIRLKKISKLKSKNLENDTRVSYLRWL